LGISSIVLVQGFDAESRFCPTAAHLLNSLERSCAMSMENWEMQIAATTISRGTDFELFAAGDWHGLVEVLPPQAHMRDDPVTVCYS